MNELMIKAYFLNYPYLNYNIKINNYTIMKSIILIIIKNYIKLKLFIFYNCSSSLNLSAGSSPGIIGIKIGSNIKQSSNIELNAPIKTSFMSFF